MTMKSLALIACLIWFAAGTFLTVERYTAPKDIPVAGGFFKYADRTPLTP